MAPASALAYISSLTSLDDRLHPVRRNKLGAGAIDGLEVKSTGCSFRGPEFSSSNYIMTHKHLE